ncbi:MAG: VWA domain-containing protein [Planctomycetota bacterium]|nr:MAG: VWA domain-containing protein [Planctomycetota bacterium]
MSALLQATGEPAQQVSLRLLELPAGWIVLLVVLPACALLGWFAYRDRKLPRGARFALSALRALALLFVCVILWRPVRERAREDVHPAVLAVLVDDSSSMLRSEDASSDPALQRARERATGIASASATRLELARAAVERVLLPHARANDYEVELYAFDAALRSVDSLAGLNGQGGATHVDDALARASERLRGRHVTDLVIVSDGRSSPDVVGATAGAHAARSAGTRVHTLLVGDPREQSNAVLELAEIPDGALAGDELALALRVRQGGAAAAALSSVTLEELEADSDPRAALPGRVLDTRECTVSANGERLVLIAPPLDAETQVTERRFRATLRPLDGETQLDDNTVVFGVPVSTHKIRVLYIEGYPRWEYRYLALHLLERTDARLEFQTWLASAEPDFRQESSDDLPGLAELPRTREELLKSYDVVLLGDVRLDQLDPDPSRAAEFCSALVGFVEAGGGLCFEAGESANPRAYLGTPLEALLPVLVDPVENAGGIGGSEEFHFQLEHPESPHEILRLVADLDANQRLLESDLRGFYWYFPVLDRRPGAIVLARHPSADNERGPLPLVVAAHHPRGRVLYLGIDSTWRWRFEFGDRYHERFWRNALRWLALERTRGAEGRVRLQAPRSTSDLGQRVALEARVLDQDWQPSSEPRQPVQLADPEGREFQIELALDPASKGTYRGDFDPDRPGSWRAWIDKDGATVARAEVIVRLPQLESRDTTPDPAALAALSRATGGRALVLEQVEELRDELPGGEEWREPISAELEDVWDGPWTLIALLSLLCVEWLLRKRWELP